MPPSIVRTSAQTRSQSLRMGRSSGSRHSWVVAVMRASRSLLPSFEEELELELELGLGLRWRRRRLGVLWDGL